MCVGMRSFWIFGLSYVRARIEYKNVDFVRIKYSWFEAIKIHV